MYPVGNTNSAFVTSIYTNLFNRAPDADGLAYWVAELDNATMTRDVMIEAMKNGATGTDATIIANKATVGLAYADAGLEGTDFSLEDVTADDATVDSALEQVAILEETAAVAAYDAALVTYNAAVATAAASLTAAEAAATTVSTVALATAAVEAANTANTDAQAVVTAAAALQAAAVETPTALDNVTAATAVTSAAAAQAETAELVTTVSAALEAAEAAEEAANAVGQTFALTTSTDTIFGTSKSDTITATQSTYTANDIIADSSSIDNDTMTITATDDITLTPTVIGIENVNFNLNAASTTTGTTFAINAANISAGTMNVAVTKAVTTVTAAALTNVKSGMSVGTNLVTLSVATVADADVTVSMTGATAAFTQTGTADTLEISSTGNFTTTGTTAEESITIASEGTVSITDAAANAASSDVDYVVTAKGNITIADITDTGSLSASTTTGNIVVGSTDLHIDGDVTLSTQNGNITVTDAEAVAATSTLTATAVGDGDAAVTGADGNVIITAASLVETVVVSATGAVTLTDVDAATDVNVKFGLASTAASAGFGSVENLILENINVDSERAVFDIADGEAQGLETVTINGSKDVTLAMAASDVAAAVTATSTLKFNNAGTGVFKLRLDDAAAVDLVGHLTNVSAIVTNAAFATGDTITLDSGKVIELGADVTELEVAGAAVAGNSVTIKVNDDDADTASDGNAWQLAALDVDNMATVTVELNDTEQTITASTYDVSSTGTLVIKGAGDLIIGTSVVADNVDASLSTGDLTIELTAAGSLEITTGSGADTFVSNNTNANYTLNGGAGVDTIVFEADDDFSANTIAWTNIEKLDLSTVAVDIDLGFAGTQMTGKDYTIVGSNASDIVTVTAAAATGENIDLSSITASGIKLVLVGSAGAEELKGSSTYATTINAGAGNDTIVGGSKVDTIDAGAGNDTITASNGADIIDGGAGADTINLTETVSAADQVHFDAVTEGSTAAIAGATFTGFDVITGFVSGTDKIDTAGIAEDGFQLFAQTAGSTSAIDLTDAEFSNVDAVAAFLADVDAGMAASELDIFVVTFSNFSAIYTVTDGGDGVAAAGEITLLGTVDAILVSGDVTIA